MSNSLQPPARPDGRAQIVGGRALRIAAAAAVAAVPGLHAGSALAKAYTAPHGKVLVGVTGGRTVDGYVKATGKRPAMFQFFVAWGDQFRWAYRRAAQAGAELMVHLSTYNGPGSAERITPRAIAMGQSDRYLFSLGRDFAAYGRPVYLRLFAEMNNAANPYSAFNQDGSARGPAHSRSWFRQAWRRIDLVLKGGRVVSINARLRALGMPHLQGVPTRTPAGVAADRFRNIVLQPPPRTVRWLPRPEVALQWAPMTSGSPDMAANRPDGYWPGAAYVDWVGTDFYSRYPNFSGLDSFYADRRFAGKPFVFGEWGIWGRDDADFTRRFFGWVASHRRVRMLAYNQGNFTTSPFRLYRYPQAARAMREALRSPLYAGRVPVGRLAL